MLILEFHNQLLQKLITYRITKEYSATSIFQVKCRNPSIIVEHKEPNSNKINNYTDRIHIVRKNSIICNFTKIITTSFLESFQEKTYVKSIKNNKFTFDDNLKKLKNSITAVKTIKK